MEENKDGRMTREEAKLLLIRPTVSSNVISETKAREIEAYNMAVEAMSERTGEWIKETVSATGKPWQKTWYRCSECRKAEYRKTNFCPNCGARMLR